MSANRRDFIKFVVAGAVTAGCPIDLSLVAAQTNARLGIVSVGTEGCRVTRMTLSNTPSPPGTFDSVPSR